MGNGSGRGSRGARRTCGRWSGHPVLVRPPDGGYGGLRDALLGVDYLVSPRPKARHPSRRAGLGGTVREADDWWHDLWAEHGSWARRKRLRVEHVIGSMKRCGLQKMPSFGLAAATRWARWQQSVSVVAGAGVNRELPGNPGLSVSAVFSHSSAWECVPRSSASHSCSRNNPQNKRPQPPHRHSGIFRVADLGPGTMPRGKYPESPAPAGSHALISRTPTPGGVLHANLGLPRPPPRNFQPPLPQRLPVQPQKNPPPPRRLGGG